MPEAKSDFPRWLHRDWKPTDQAPGLHVPGQSKLVYSADEVKEHLAKGWTEAAPIPQAKKDDPKKG